MSTSIESHLAQLEADEMAEEAYLDWAAQMGMDQAQEATQAAYKAWVADAMDAMV